MGTDIQWRRAGEEQQVPDIVVHNTMGNIVFDKLKSDTRDRINYDIYRFSVMGPDPFIFYRFFAPPFKHKYNRRSTTMHTTHTGEFFVEIAKRAKINADDNLFSYLAGFLCHYALDGDAHPYVNMLASNDVNRHRAIEKRLDQIELERQGMDIRKRPVTRRVFPPFLPESLGPSINGILRAVYGWDESWSILKTSYRHMKLFHWIAEDPRGIFDRYFSGIHPKLYGISYRSSVCAELDYDWFWPVLDKSVNEAVSYIEACYDFMTDIITEPVLRSIIGNRSYSTGKEVE